MVRVIFSTLLFVIAFSFASAQPPAIYTGNFNIIGKSLAIFTDSNSNIPIQDAVQSNRYRPSANIVPNLSITNNSYWVKFTIVNTTTYNKLAIQITQAIIDYIDFYEFHKGVLIYMNKSGDRRPFYSRIVAHTTFIYPLSVSQNDSVTCYLHIRSGKQLMLPVYLGSQEQVLVNSYDEDILFGIYVGIILVMLLYNLFVYVSVRDKNYLYYVLYLLVVLITQPLLQGYTFRFVLPGHPYLADLSIYITSAAIGIAAIEFSKSFLASRNLTPTLHKLSYIFWVIYIATVILAVVGQYNLSYSIILAAAMVSSVYVLGMAIVILLKGSRSARFFLIAWSVFILCVCVYVLKDFGLLPYNQITNFSLLIGSAFEAIMLSFALADKINIYKAEKEESQAQALLASQENARIIREQNVILDAQVKERTQELEASNEGLNKAMKELKDAETHLVESEKMASLGQLTAGIAHEINNPINFVTSNVKPLSRDVRILLEVVEQLETIMKSDSTPAEKEKQIEEYKEEIDYGYLKEEIDSLLKGIGDGASRTAEIVKGLRVFSRLDEDDLKKADINEGIDSTLVIINNLLNGKVQVVKKYGNIPLIECYPGKLNQVFLNIMSNGIYAIIKQHEHDNDGMLTITTSNDETYVYISIADNGTGMDEKTKKKLFEPFFTTKDVGEGTGLGLSIVYNTIAKHNGEIDVNSVIGQGTEFIIKLPIIH